MHPKNKRRISLFLGSIFVVSSLLNVFAMSAFALDGTVPMEPVTVQVQELNDESAAQTEEQENVTSESTVPQEPESENAGSEPMEQPTETPLPDSSDASVEQPDTAPTLTPEPTVAPTASPRPSATPAPSATPMPSATPTPAASMVPLIPAEPIEIGLDEAKAQIRELLEKSLKLTELNEEQLAETAEQMEQFEAMPAMLDEQQDEELQGLMEQLVNAKAAVEDMRLAYQAQREGWLDQLPQTGKENSWRYQNGVYVEPADQLGLELPEGVRAVSTKDGYRGIDVSHHQGIINWDAVKAAGIEFAIIRCGYGIDQVDQDDAQWNRNVAECERLGIPYGVYFYSYAVTSEMAVQEGMHAVRLLKGHKPQLPVFFDMEENRQLVVGNDGLAEIARIFCDIVSNAGYKVGVYANLSWWNNYLTSPIFENWYRWVAEWHQSCHYNGRYEMWQYTNSGSVNGINGRVDMNYWYGWPLVSRVDGLTVAGDARGVRISWNALKGASSYRVYRKTGNGAWHMLKDVTTASYVDTSAVSDTTYSYTVAACKKTNEGNWWSTYDQVGKSLHYIAQPVIKNAERGADRVTITWNTVKGANSYRVFRRIGNGAWRMMGDVTSTSYVDTSVVSNSTYSYSVAACKKTSTRNWWSSYGTAEKTIIHMAQPTVTSVAGSAKGVSIKWDAVNGATSYRIFRKTENGAWRMLKDVTYPNYVDTSAESDTTYSYTVAACKKTNTGNWWSTYNQTEKSILYIAQPTIKSAEKGTDRVTVTWNAVKGANSYRVFRRIGNGAWRMIGDMTSTSYVDTNVVSNSTYSYSVAACKKTNERNWWSSYGVEEKTILYMGQPKVTSVAGSANGVSIKWDAVNGANSYRVYRKTENGPWRMLKDVNSTNYVDTSAESGMTYSYAVAACKKTSAGNWWSTYDNTGKSLLYIAQPEVSSVASGANGTVVSWDAVKGANSYRVYRKTGNGAWHLLKDVSSANYIDASAESGVNYSYTVAACKRTDAGNWWSTYNNTGKSLLYIAQPEVSSVTSGANGVVVSWDAVNGATSYRIFRKTENGPWRMLKDVNSTNYVDTSAESGMTYSYAVAACKKTSAGNWWSTYNNTGKPVTYIAQPEVSSVTSGANGVVVSWDAVKGANSYRVYRKTENGPWRMLKDVSSAGYVDTGAESGTSYTYTVAACKRTDAGNWWSTYNNTGKTLVHIAQPKVNSAVATANGVSVKWDTVKGANSYRVFRKTENGSWRMLGDVSSASYVDASAEHGTTYAYSVSACKKTSARNWWSTYDNTGFEIKYK